jgi:hypothetical protein
VNIVVPDTSMPMPSLGKCGIGSYSRNWRVWCDRLFLG